MGILAGPKARREPAGEAKPDVCVISDGVAGAFCTVGLVFSPLIISKFYQFFWMAAQITLTRTTFSKNRLCLISG